MRLPRVRLSVRAMMALVLVLGGGLGWVVHQARVQRDAVAAIQQAGGYVLYDWELKTVRTRGFADFRPNPAGRPWCPKWLVDLLGPDYFGGVKLVTIPRGVKNLDAVMPHVGRLDGLEALQIGSGATLSESGAVHLRGLNRLRIFYTEPNVKITVGAMKDIGGLHRIERLTLRDDSFDDAHLAPLKGLAALSNLEITSSGVTDAGMVYLKEIPGLTELYLVRCQVTDAGLKELAGLKRLTKLMALHTGVTSAGVSILQRARPNLQILSR